MTVEENQPTLLDHLEDLRRRLLVIIGVLIVTSLVSFISCLVEA